MTDTAPDKAVMAGNSGAAGKGSSQSDLDAVTELLADIEGELRLHQLRIREFLDGTNEFGAIGDPRGRARLLRTAQALTDTLADLAELSV